jgi:predicted PurR-regulated permease PerM
MTPEGVVMARVQGQDKEIDIQDAAEPASDKVAESATPRSETSSQHGVTNGQQSAGPVSSAPPEERWTAEHHPHRRASDRTRRSILAGQTVVAVAVVLTICYLAKLVLVTILFSILLAYILFPVMDFLERLKFPRPLASLFAVLLMASAIYAAAFFGYSRAIDFMETLPTYTHRIESHLMRFREQAQKFQKSTEAVLPPAPEDKRTIKVEQQTNWWEVVTNSLGTVGDIVLCISFVPFLVYFMLSWHDHARASTVMLFSMENRNTAYVTLGRISAMINTFINGNILVGLFTSIASLAVFWYLHLPYFYFLGFISGFLTLVPYLGVILAVLPPLAAGLGQVHGGGLLTIVITVVGLHVFALNVLYPKLIGKRLQLNPLAVTIALLIWGWLWGAVGLILAVPLTAALKIIFDNVESMRPYGAWLGE